MGEVVEAFITSPKSSLILRGDLRGAVMSRGRY
jgi:hypothetical protein